MSRDHQYHSGSRDRRSRRSSTNSGSSRQHVRRLHIFDVFNNQKVFTFCLIAMVIVIVEFQGIHEARVQHTKLREMHLQEQSLLQSIEKDVISAVHQASDAFGSSTSTEDRTTLPLDINQQKQAQEYQESLIVDASTSQEQQQTQANTNLRGQHPIQHISANSEALIIPPKQIETEKPKPKSQWNLPAPSKNKALIPSTLEQLADISDPYSKVDRDVPFFFHVAKAGGTSVKHMYSDCYGLVEACESGVAENHLRDITLKVVTLESGWKFVNVDTTTPRGIERAARFNMARSGKADLLVSPLPHEVTPQIFNRHKGRMFTILRDPLERVVSLFYYLQKAKHEPTYNPALQSMTFEEYVYSPLAESNFMTRTLINKMEAAFEEKDFEVAKEILRTKCLVGLLDQLDESVRRFDLYFGFVEQAAAANHPVDPTCTVKYLKTGTNRHSHPSLPAVGTPLYQELQRKNHMDVRLYAYARELFDEQATIFATGSAITS